MHLGIKITQWGLVGFFACLLWFIFIYLFCFVFVFFVLRLIHKFFSAFRQIQAYFPTGL